MDIVKFSIAKPVTVTVGVILLVMFGLIGLTAIPIQLTPTVDRPVITVTTEWPGRSPDEIVDEITKEQEERLKNVSNLKTMKSTSREGQSEIQLEFYIGADVSRALLEVNDRLRQVPDYPDDVDEPTIKAADGASENAIAWIIIDLPDDKIPLHPGFEVATLFDALDKEVKPFLERIDGVAEVNIYGGRDREVQVLLDATALAQRGLNQLDVIAALRGENRNVSAGTIAEGKRDYRVRLVGQYTTPEQVLETMIDHRDGRPVYVKDIGTVEIGNVKERGFVRTMGHPAIAMNVIRQSDANVVEVMEVLRERLDVVRTDVLPNLGGYTTLADGARVPVGPDLRLRQVYDETTYIDSAIALVTDNLWIGAALAALILLLFLRSFVSTGIIAIAIPISVVGTFLILLALGRTLNVISLAGLAFAVGMVVDNAIVVLENIYRRLQNGDPPMRAAYLGGKEVWGAVLASTLTTAAVFVPVLTIEEEAGQLFRDISLAIVASVSLSLIVSVTVIPAACSRWLRVPPEHKSLAFRLWDSAFGLAPVCARIVAWLGAGVRWMITGWRAWTVRPAVILVMTVASLVGSWLLMPPMDYLPAGNRNLVFGGLLIPPGMSVDQQREIAQRIEAQVGPYADASLADPESVAALRPIPRGFPGQPDAPPPFDPVPIDNFFIGAFGGGMFVGATSEEEQIVIPVGQLLSNSMQGIPDAFGGARQTSLFGRGVGGGNTIDLEIAGPDLDRVTAAAGFMMGIAGPRYGFDKVSPSPSNFNLTQPEWRIAVNQRGRELGLTTESVGVAVRGLFDGAFAGDFKLDGENVDLVVLPSGGRLEYKEQLAQIPISTPAGRVVPLDTVVDVVPSLAPQEIQRVEELPAVTLQITPPDGQAIEATMADIERTLIAPAREAGMIDRQMRIRLEGTAAKLDEVRAALLGPKPDLQADRPAWQDGMLAFSGFMLAVGGLVGLGMIATAAPAAVRKAPKRTLIGAALLVLGLLSLSGIWMPELLQSIGVQEPEAISRLLAGPRDTVRWIGTGVGAVSLLTGYALLATPLFTSRGGRVYGGLGLIVLAVVLAGLVGGVALSPQLVLARFVWALAVTYLLMCALFESFTYPFVIMFSVPLAIVGGFAGLAIVHWWTLQDPTRAPQQFDVLTMLGFVILIGVVVNNAILLVYQALNFMRGVGESEDDIIEKMSPTDAVVESARTRVRPIMMSVLTSVLGMLPLVVNPGAGSEMYQGLGSVVVGGLLVSTIFTLLLVPLTFSLVLDMTAGLRGVLRRGGPAGEQSGGAAAEPNAPAPDRDREQPDPHRNGSPEHGERARPGVPALA